MIQFILVILFLSPGNSFYEKIHASEENSCLDDYQGKLDIVWSEPLRPDTTIGNSIYPVIYDDLILYNELYIGQPNTFYAFDPETGKKRWSWNDFDMEYDDLVIRFNYSNQKVDDKFYISYGSRKMLFDTKKQSLDWVNKIDLSSAFITGGNEYLYTIRFNDRNDNTPHDSELLRVKKDKTPGWESIFIKKGGSNERHVFQNPVEWLNPTGDTTLLFTSGRITSTSGTVSDLYAFNTSKNELSWLLANFTGISGPTKHLPIISGNKAYILNRKTVSCIDLISGYELWESKDLEDGFSRCNPILADDKIIVHGDNGKLHAINTSDGNTIWSHSESFTAPTNMAYYAGAIYFCVISSKGGFLCGVNIENGKIFLREASPNKVCRPKASYSWGLSIDEDTGRLYTLDGFFAMCIQLDKRSSNN